MDDLPFYLVIAVALIDVGLAAWFIARGRKEGANTPAGRARLMVGGTLLCGAVLIAAIAFFLFSPFG